MKVLIGESAGVSVMKLLLIFAAPADVPPGELA